MNTDELVRFLASRADAVPAHAIPRRYALALVLATVAALVLTAVTLGLNPSLMQDAATPMFWVKEFFCAGLSAAGVVTAARLGRPGRTLGWAPIGIAVPLLVMWLLAATVLLGASTPAERDSLVMGHTALVCPFLIAIVSSPIFVAFMWLMRGQAPTRLRLTGAAAGFAAGAMGALVYALHCPEFAAPFLGLWYVLGMLIPTLVGAWAGPQLLRW